MIATSESTSRSRWRLRSVLAFGLSPYSPHVWPTVEFGINDTLYLREVSDGTAYHRLLTLPAGVYRIGTLGAALQAQLRAETHIPDGVWSVSSQDGQLTLHQSSPTAAAILYSRADVRGYGSVPTDWTFASGYVQSSSDWPTIWSAANVRPGLPPNPQDAC